MAKFDYTIAHVPGKLLYRADALSRDPVPNKGPDPLEEEVEDPEGPNPNLLSSITAALH